MNDALDRAAASDVASGIPRFDDFYSRGYGAVVRVVWSLTGRWSIAEEIAQEAFMAAFDRWDVVATLENPELWVRRVALNRAISTHRRFLAEVAALARARVAVSTEQRLPIEHDHVWGAVRRLPRRQASALVLTAVDGLSLAEVGEVLGCSAETARTHLRRAQSRLRALLKEHE